VTRIYTPLERLFRGEVSVGRRWRGVLRVLMEANADVAAVRSNGETILMDVVINAMKFTDGMLAMVITDVIENVKNKRQV
jgi:hypothetical protein